MVRSLKCDKPVPVGVSKHDIARVPHYFLSRISIHDSRCHDRRSGHLICWPAQSPIPELFLLPPFVPRRLDYQLNPVSLTAAH